MRHCMRHGMRGVCVIVSVLYISIRALVLLYVSISALVYSNLRYNDRWYMSDMKHVGDNGVATRRDPCELRQDDTLATQD